MSERSDNWQLMDECHTCGIWQKVKRGPDGNLYCSIHLQREKDLPISKKRADAGIKWINDFRSMEESNPV